jgi:hypothetical protein
MEWSNTEASKARWSEFAEANWGNWDFIWEECRLDYQGDVAFIATKDGKYVYCSWYYGSCSGCDPWEDMSTEKAKADFDNHAIYFDNMEQLVIWGATVNYGNSFDEVIDKLAFTVALEKEIVE